MYVYMGVFPFLLEDGHPVEEKDEKQSRLALSVAHYELTRFYYMVMRGV